MGLKIFYFFSLSIFSLILSNDSVIDIGVSSVKKLSNGEYLIDIYAKNSVPIAGIQFDILGEPFKDQKNGKWDKGEKFTDLNSNISWDEAEPFLDEVNNDWDFGEPFTDLNKNDKYDNELFTILEVTGGRAEKNGFNFHIGKNRGIILAFSMKGNSIAPSKDLESLSLFTIKVKKNSKTPLEFNIHSIIAGQKGVKIDSQFIPTVIK